MVDLMVPVGYLVILEKDFEVPVENIVLSQGFGVLVVHDEGAENRVLFLGSEVPVVDAVLVLRVQDSGVFEEGAWNLVLDFLVLGFGVPVEGAVLVVLGDLVPDVLVLAFEVPVENLVLVVHVHVGTLVVFEEGAGNLVLGFGSPVVDAVVLDHAAVLVIPVVNVVPEVLGQNFEVPEILASLEENSVHVMTDVAVYALKLGVLGVLRCPDDYGDSLCDHRFLVSDFLRYYDDFHHLEKMVCLCVARVLRYRDPSCLDIFVKGFHYVLKVLFEMDVGNQNPQNQLPHLG